MFKMFQVVLDVKESVIVVLKITILWKCTSVLLGGAVTSWLVRSFPDRAVRVRAQAGEIGPLQDPVTWYGINYAGTQVTQWDFQNNGTRTSQARLSFVLEVPLCNLRPSVINSVPCDWILQRAY